MTSTVEIRPLAVDVDMTVVGAMPLEEMVLAIDSVGAVSTDAID